MESHQYYLNGNVAWLFMMMPCTAATATAVIIAGHVYEDS